MFEGLTVEDIRIYDHIASHGPMDAKDMAVFLGNSGHEIWMNEKRLCDAKPIELPKALEPLGYDTPLSLKFIVRRR